jgi:dTDP-4-dehydrorhamnose reductase
MTPRILITGAHGQLGKALAASGPENVERLSVDQNELDITDLLAVRAAFTDFRPTHIINAAAYTAVDQAESDSHQAYAVNGDGTRHLAQTAQTTKTRLIHISTDFVFNGRQGAPYKTTALTEPLQVYGASKLAGEQAIKAYLPQGQWLILRTAWLYGVGSANFVQTMLRLMANGTPLRVVADQVGSPTCASGLAQAVWQALENNLSGIHHWSDSGVASWYDFAVAIQEEALKLGLLTHPVEIEPVSTDQYPTPARRPAYSVLDKSTTFSALGITASHWRECLRAILAEEAQLRAQPSSSENSP